MNWNTRLVRWGSRVRAGTPRQVGRDAVLRVCAQFPVAGRRRRVPTMRSNFTGQNPVVRASLPLQADSLRRELPPLASLSLQWLPSPDLSLRDRAT